MQIGSANCAGPLLSAGKSAYPVGQTKNARHTGSWEDLDMSWTTFKMLAARFVAAALAFDRSQCAERLQPDRPHRSEEKQPEHRPEAASDAGDRDAGRQNSARQDQLPAGFKAELYSQGHPGGRTMVMGSKGTIFMGTRGPGRVYAITNGRQARGQGPAAGPDAAERPRVPRRLALRVRDPSRCSATTISRTSSTIRASRST